MAYSKYTWTVSEPITQERMNHIEDGIADAHSNASVAESKADSAISRLNTVDTTLANVSTVASQAALDANEAMTATEYGRKAWQQVDGALIYDPDTNEILTNLATRFQNDESNISTATTNINLLNTEIRTARGQLIHTGNSVAATNLKAKLDDMDTQISLNQGAISATQQDYDNATGAFNTLSARLNRIDGNSQDTSSVPGGRLGVIEAELDAARDGLADIDARFDADETRIGNVETNKIAYSDIVNDLLTNNINKPLSAAQGRELKQIIGGTFSSTSGNTVKDGIDTAEQNAKDYADAHKVDKTDIYNDIDYTTDDGKVLDARVGKALADRIDAIDNSSTGTIHGLDVRLGAVEDELDDARVQIGTDDNSGDPIYGTLDNRFDSVEARATQLESDVNKIANELAMYDISDTIQNNNTRIDTIEENVVAMAKEIGMLQDQSSVVDLSTAVSRTDTRVDDIESRLDTLDGAGGTIAGLDTRLTSAEGDIDTLESAINTPNTGLDARITSLEDTIEDNSTGLAATKAIADSAATASSINSSNISSLTTRVTTLEGKDTVILTNVTFTNGAPVVTNPSTNCDYLLQEANDDKYYYWRYFGAEEGWQLISGVGGGGGSSSGEIVSELPQASEASETTDYFVGNNETGYLHYRFTTINGVKQAILIGVNPNNIKNYALTTSVDNDSQKNYIDFYSFDYGVDSSEIDQGTRIAHIEMVGGGGGGTYNSKTITRITPRSGLLAQNSEEKVLLRFFYTSGTANESDDYVLTHSNATTAATVIRNGTIDSGDPADASNTWPTEEVDGEMVPVDQADCDTGFYVFDVTNYCTTLGKQTFTLTISDSDDPSIYTQMKWEITVINLVLRSEFSQNYITSVGRSVDFVYIPESGGNIEKTAYFYLDGNSIGTVNLGTRANTEQTFTIPAQNTEGVHQLSARLGTTSGNKTIYSEFLYRDIIWRNTDSSSTIISSPCRGRTIDVKQYNAVEIPYTIAGTTSSYTVQYFIDDMSTPYNEVVLTNRNSEVWTYRPYSQGTHTLRIKTGEAYIDITLNVLENEVDIAPYTDGLILNFDPTGLSNNSEIAKNWTNGTYHLTTSDNFDWQNGGYGSDASGDYFLIKSGTRAYFDYKMFTQEMESITTQDNQTIDIPTSKVYKTGQEMKLIFKTSAVRAIDAVWFTNAAKYDAAVEKTVGIQLSAHEGWLRTDSASDVAVTQGDEQVAATNTYLYFPYSEEDRIELDININKEDSANGAVTMSYEDGVPSKAYAYTHNQKLYHVQGQEAIITIGSDDCDVYVYKLKIYNKELTQAQVLRNFIADGRNVDESIARYERNCIYYDAENDEYSPYLTSGFELNAEALAKKIPNVKVLMLDTPTFTLNKKSFIKDSTLRCIHAEGGNIYPSRGAQDNWYFENGYHAGQGTTSDKYGDSGRNIDFLFNCDGSHKPSDKVNPDASYVSRVTTGYGTDQAQVSVVSDWKGDSGKISLTSTSIPNNFFNFKVNIASSENVNNALLQKRYNDFLPYISPARARDTRIKNDMEFVPAVLFVRENSTTAVHSEFGDTEWHFYALGNLGDSKKTDYTRAYDPTDINEFTIEISDNNTNNSQFQTGVYMVNGVPTLEQFEAVQDIDDDGNLIEDSYTAQGRSGAIATTDYVYPLDTPQLKALWEATDPETGEYLNKNHWSLVNEPYDGDHSFEMRYAFYGNFRDGKLVNGNKEESKAIQKRNSKVWQAFYSWVVTASNEEFVRDLDQWCVRSAVEFWYAFTHYYTMMDNRAKNTFWHFAKTGKHRRVLNPLKDMIHTYDESNNAVMEEDGTYSGTFTPTEDTVVDPEKTYYTEYAFDLWDYDNDTALGIDNNGELIFPYGKEDSDYKIGDNAASGYVFNGAGSVFWRRLRDLCSGEISSIFNTVNEQFFSAENLIESFDNFQSCYPEAIWQLDVWRKYIRPFIQDMGKTLPNGSTEYLTRKDVKFLETMMQGRKKYQRRQWIRDQYYYFGSKYKLNNVTEDFFLLDCYTGPDDALIAELKAQGRNDEAAQYVGSNWDITITPYQDMYINASFGETAKAPVRAKAGQPVEMTCPFTSMNNTRIYIYGASRLSALAGKAIRNGNDEIIGAEGLASLYVGNNRLQRTAKLQHLYLGTDKPTYRNANLTNLALNENSPILETLDIRNCGDIAGELKLSGCNNLRTLEAEGTSINLVTLPASSQIETLHLPSSVTSLSLSAARKLDDFYIFNKATQSIDYTSLRSLLIDSSDKSDNINWLSIASENLSNYNYLYLLNLEKSSVVDINELAAFAEKKEALEAAGTNTVTLSGTIHVTGAYSLVEEEEYEELWAPNLDIDVSAGTLTPKHKVTYKYDDITDGQGNIIEQGAVIKTLYINSSLPIIDIWEYTDEDTQEKVHILSEMPSRAPTVQNTYQFGLRESGIYIPFSGWKLQGSSVPISSLDSVPTVGNSDIVVETYFKVNTRTYPIKWYLEKNANGTPKESTLIKTSGNPVPYGGGYDEEAPTIPEIHAKGFQTATASANSGLLTYSIFNGWEKLPTNINPSATDTSYNIFANWDTGTIDLQELFADTTTFSPLQLLALSVMDSNARNYAGVASKVAASKQFTYTLGQDSIKEGIELVGPNATRKILRLGLATSNPAIFNDIQPLSPANDAFTIAIDYCFTQDSTYSSQYNAAVLASCYSIDASANTVTGFALYDNLNNSNNNNSGPRVGFGNMFGSRTQSVPVGTNATKEQRNIVVLRHPAGDTNLYIYSGLGNNDSIQENITVQQIAWNNSTSNAPLILGRITNSNESQYSNIKNIVANGKGTIYWAKYWDEDLGLGECKRLAAWPHEETTYAFSAYNASATGGERVGVNAPTPAIELVSFSVSSHGKLVQGQATVADGARTGWGTSVARSICNNRIFYGLPTELQAILCKPEKQYKDFVVTYGNEGNNTYELDSMISSSRDYVYLPSVINLTTIDSAYEAEELNSVLKPYAWLNDSTRVQVYNYDANVSNRWVASSESNPAHYLNLRFVNKSISASTTNPLRVFVGVGATITGTIYTEVNRINDGIKAGDVFINNEDTYIYVTNSEINDKGLPIVANEGIFDTDDAGGWLKASEYWTRSMGHSMNANSQSTKVRFAFVDNTGAVNIYDTRNQSSGLKLNYSLSI